MNSPFTGIVSFCQRFGGFKSKLALVALALFSVSSVWAQTTETPKYDEEFFSGITYQWTDKAGKTHTSTLAEPATEYEQIVEFLREVYINPRVPGFIRDVCWTGDTTDNKYAEVPYEPCVGLGNPYHMDNLEIKKPDEGCTAILVEVEDFYDGKVGVDGDSIPKQLADKCSWYLRQLKRVSILTHQHYVGPDVSEKNPGYLFNYVGPLNRFFVITKGNNRIALNSNYNSNGDCVEGEPYRGHAPFFNMYEEFSPANNGAVYNAFAEMASGNAFAVDHNCTTIMGQDHTTVMSPALKADKSNIDDFHEYSGNFKFFVPDYRFYGDTRTSHTTSYVSNEYYTFYDEHHMPYYFFNVINAQIRKRPQLVSKEHTDWADDESVLGVANVRIDWTSTYNDIVGYEANESFYIYRVIDGVIEDEPVPRSQLLVPGYDEETKIDYSERIHLGGREDQGDDLTVDPSVIVARISTPAIYVQEPRYAESYDVYYVVKGRRYRTDFALVESNIVTSFIPGVSEKNKLNIQIDGDRKSEHKIEERKNYYKYRIDLIDKNYDNGTEMTLQRRHIRTADDATVEVPTKFKLMRYTGNKKSRAAAEEIACITMTKTMVDRYDQFEFWGDVTYTNDPEKNEENIMICKAPGIIFYLDDKLLKGDDLVEALYGKSPTITLDALANYVRPGETELDEGELVRHNAVLDVVALDEKLEMGHYKDAIFTFFDEFSVETQEGTHPEMYSYYVDYIPAEFKNGSIAAFDDESNLVEFEVPKSNLMAGYVPYTEQQIIDDETHGNRLPINKPGVKFERDINANVDNYTVYRIAAVGDNKPTVVARATRQVDGTLYYERLNSRGQLASFGKSSNSRTPAIELPYGASVNDEFDIVIKYKTGNTYGNRVAFVYETPYPHIYDVSIKAGTAQSEDKMSYTATVDWNSQKLESPVPGDETQYYTRYGYRAWGFGGHENEEGEYTSHYGLLDRDKVPRTSAPAMHKAARATVPDQGDFISKEHTFEAHPATEADKLQYNAHVRLYAQLPSTMNITESSEPGYIVSDKTFTRTIASPNDYPTEVADIVNDDENAPVEYYSLQGVRIDNPVPGTIVIRRQGNTVTKVRIQ